MFSKRIGLACVDGALDLTPLRPAEPGDSEFRVDATRWGLSRRTGGIGNGARSFIMGCGGCCSTWKLTGVSPLSPSTCILVTNDCMTCKKNKIKQESALQTIHSTAYIQILQQRTSRTGPLSCFHSLPYSNTSTLHTSRGSTSFLPSQRRLCDAAICSIICIERLMTPTNSRMRFSISSLLIGAESPKYSTCRSSACSCSLASSFARA